MLKGNARKDSVCSVMLMKDEMWFVVKTNVCHECHTPSVNPSNEDKV